MKMTADGLALIRRHEGFRKTAYRCPAGVWTIGYGHTSMAGPPAVAGGLEISREQANEILRRDVETVARQVSALLATELSDGEFSALVSFAYNVGIGNFRKSSVLKSVNCGDRAAVPRRLQMWIKAGGKVLPGLIRRRAAEAELFLGNTGPAPDITAVEPIEGKPAYRSTTNLAAVISALAGIVSTLVGSAREATDAFGGPAIGLTLVAVMIAAGLWIVRERHLKSIEEGV